MNGQKPVRVLIAEDSELFAQTIVEILELDRTFEVFGIARDGAEAVRMTELGRPDIVLMDVRMPGMDGLAAIEGIMDRCPTPILVMTADPAGKTGELSFEALRRGALDLVPKPTTWAGTPAEQEDLRSRLLALSRIRVLRRKAGPSERPQAPEPTPIEPARSGLRNSRVVGLVSSTGGPPVLGKILGGLPASFPFCIVIVQHLSDGFCDRFADWLGHNTKLRVELARHGGTLAPGLVLIAPDRKHLTVEGRLQIRLDDSPPIGGHRPSGTTLLRSIARSFGRQAIGGVLTGMGADGAEGLLDIQRANGFTFAQDARSCVVHGMPGQALALGAATRSLTPDQIVRELSRLGCAGSGALKP